jgi:uncharacterized membrane protein
MPVIEPALLRNIPLFQMFDDEELATLAGQLEEVNLLTGERLFKMGDTGDEMYLVQEGRIELYLQDKANERVRLGIVECGDMFGELALLHKEPRTASAKALENSKLIAIDQADLEFLFTKHPGAALDMMAMLSRRVREANLLVRERVTRNVNEEVPESRTFGERLSDFLTMLAGDIRFVYFSFVWFLVWIGGNLLLEHRIISIPGVEAFDPFPYGLLTMVVSLEAIFLSLFVLISQNRQAAREKVRNDIEYEVNLKAELEIRALGDRIEELEETLVKHLSALKVYEAAKQTKEANSIGK